MNKSILLSVEQARNQLLEAFLPKKTEQVELGHTQNRILAQDIFAPFDLPGFDNSSMDGFAVCSEDTLSASLDHPLKFQVAGEIPAGTTPHFSLQKGQTAQIMTGAPLPEGADAVIRVEDTDQSFIHPEESRAGWIQITQPVYEGYNVRRRGADIKAGESLLAAGSSLTPQSVGVAAMCGLAVLPVYAKVRVALLTTGSELLQPGEPLSPGKIYDANSYFLSALLKSAGCEITRLDPLPDDPDKIKSALDLIAAASYDLILTSAGISVGSHDPIRAVIEQAGTLSFWRVNVRPGKPIAFGFYLGIPLIALPGNPVSAFVTYLLFVQPVIRKLSGYQEVLAPKYEAVLQSPVFSDGRESYLRGNVIYKDGHYLAIVQNNQESSHLASLTRANALLIVPSGVKSLPTGSKVDFLWVNAYTRENDW